MKKQVFLVFGIFLLIGAPLVLLTVSAVTFSLPRVYYANTRILVERGQPVMQTREPSVSGGAHTIFQMDQVEILRSQKIGYSVVDKEQLVAKWAIPGPESFAKEQAFHILRGRLSVQPLRNSSIIEVGFYSTDPVESADMANAITIVYRESVTGDPHRYRVSIIDLARPPTAPCKPNVPVYIGVGLVVAVTLAGGGILLILLGRNKQRIVQPPPLPRV